MDNYIIKTLAYKKQARILFVDNTKMIKEICGHKNINKLLKTSLGKTVSVASLISGTLKGNQRVSIKVNASNRKYKIFADADSFGNVRGYINDELLSAPLDCGDNLSIEGLIGDRGCIQVLKDLGMNSMFTGITDMPYGNIVDDFSYYFKQSEQTTTLFFINMVYNEDNEIALSIGVMAQLLPGASINLMDTIKEKISENLSVLSCTDNIKNFREQRLKLKKHYDMLNTAEAKGLADKWSRLISLFQAEMDKGTPIDNSRVIELGKEWRQVIDFFTGGDIDIIESSERYYSENPQAAKGTGMNGELYIYIKEVLSNIK